MENELKGKKCCAKYYKGVFDTSHQCQSLAKVKRGNFYYCKRHDPLPKKQKEEIKYEEWKREIERKRENQRLLSLVPEFLEACKLVASLKGFEPTEEYGIKILSVIAKAEVNQAKG